MSFKISFEFQAETFNEKDLDFLSLVNMSRAIPSKDADKSTSSTVNPVKIIETKSPTIVDQTLNKHPVQSINSSQKRIHDYNSKSDANILIKNNGKSNIIHTNSYVFLIHLLNMNHLIIYLSKIR